MDDPPENTEALPVAAGGGVLPGVDLEDGPCLADLLDDDTPLDALR